MGSDESHPLADTTEVKFKCLLNSRIFGVQSWFVHCDCGALLCYCYSVHMMCNVYLNDDSFSWLM